MTAKNLVALKSAFKMVLAFTNILLIVINKFVINYNYIFFSSDFTIPRLCVILLCLVPVRFPITKLKWQQQRLFTNLIRAKMMFKNPHTAYSGSSSANMLLIHTGVVGGWGVRGGGKVGGKGWKGENQLQIELLVITMFDTFLNKA